MHTTNVWFNEQLFSGESWNLKGNEDYDPENLNENHEAIDEPVL